MPEYLPFQQSFAAGEISPKLYGRFDIEGRKAGCEIMENFLALPQGPGELRWGFRKFADFADGTTTVGKVFGFPVDFDTAFYVVITSGKIQVYEEGAYTPVLDTTHPWADTEIPDLQAEITPEGDEMYIVSRLTSPRKLSYTAPSTFALSAITFTSQPAQWVANNYPGTITFFQGRSWWGGTPAQPATFWASKSGVYTDMTTGSLADDAMVYTMSKRGQIQWMAGLKKLLIGTEYHEFTVESSTGLIIPGDITTDVQSSYGSSYVQPALVGDKAVYVSLDGRKLRDIGYVWTEDGWTSRDIIFVSEHLTKDNRVTNLVFAQNSDNLLACVTENNELIMATYERGNDIIGWIRMPITGDIVAVGQVSKNGVNVIGAVFDRGITSDNLTWELFAPDNEYLDCYWVITHGTASTSITGITYLANQTVGVKVDGANHPDITLDASGNGTTDWAGNEIIIGFRYSGKIKTLPLGQILQLGSTVPLSKKWNQIYLKLVESAYPIINGDRPPLRHPSTPMGNPEPLHTGDIKVTGLGWDKYGQVTIIQDLPFKTTVAGIFGESTEEKL